MSDATDSWSTQEQTCTSSAPAVQAAETSDYRSLLTVSSSTPSPPVSRPLDWTVEDVQKFLTALGLSDLQPAFREHEVSGLVLLTLSERDLECSLGVRKFGHRRRLALAIAELQQRVMAAKKAQALHTTDSFNVTAEPSSAVASTGSVSSRPPSPGPRSRSASPAPPSLTPDHPRRPTAIRPLASSPGESKQEVILQSPTNAVQPDAPQQSTSSATLPPGATPMARAAFSVERPRAASPMARFCGPDGMPLVTVPRQGSRTPHLPRAGSPLRRCSPPPVRALSPRRCPDSIVMSSAQDGWRSPSPMHPATNSHKFVQQPVVPPRPPTSSAGPHGPRENSLPTRIHSSPRRTAPGTVPPQVVAMPIAPMHPGDEWWQLRNVPSGDSGPGMFRPAADSHPRMLASGTSRRSRSGGPPGVYCGGVGSLAAPTVGRDIPARLH